MVSHPFVPAPPNPPLRRPDPSRGKRPGLAIARHLTPNDPNVSHFWFTRDEMKDDHLSGCRLWEPKRKTRGLEPYLFARDRSRKLAAEQKNERLKQGHHACFP